MTNPWLIWFEAGVFGFEALSVMTLRAMKHASGGDVSGREARRMVTEKVAALGTAQLAAAGALAGGRPLATAVKRAAAPYRKRVRANRRRLTKTRR